MTATIVMERLRDYVQQNFLYARPDFVLDAKQPLIGTGVVDSMGIMELITFIDESFGVNVEDEEITEANMGDLASMTEFVMRKRTTTEAVA